MTDLMLHCGANRVSEADVRSAVTPASTVTHYPIGHNVLLDEAIKLIASHGFDVKNAAHALSHEGGRYFGLLEVSPKAPAAPARLALTAGTDGANHTDGLIRPDFTTVFGLRNSHDMAFAASMVVGSHVFVCDNLCFSGEVKMARKHTRRILDDLPTLMSAAMGKLVTMRNHQDLRIQSYKDTEIDARTADHLIMEGFRKGVVPGSKVGKVWGEWNAPSHEDFEDRTVWSLFNAFTEVLKTRGQIFEQPKYGQALHGIMDVASKVLPMKRGVEQVGDGEVEVQRTDINAN